MMSETRSFDLDHASRSLARLLRPAGRMLESFGRAVGRRRKAGRDYFDLTKMTDPELRDIGIGRFDIAAVLAEEYWRTAPKMSPRKRPMTESASKKVEACCVSRSSA